MLTLCCFQLFQNLGKEEDTIYRALSRNPTSNSTAVKRERGRDTNKAEEVPDSIRSLGLVKDFGLEPKAMGKPILPSQECEA